MVSRKWMPAVAAALLLACSETVVEVIPVATLSIEGLPATLLPGGSAQLSVRALGSGGQVLANRSFTFASSNTGVATVSGTGLVTAVAPGSINITASAEGAAASQALAVNFPVPTVTSVLPVAIATGTATTITVRGTGFFPGSIVRVNNVAKMTTFVSNTELRAAIAAGDFPTATATQVTVFNPAPGGGSSTAQTLNVRPAGCLITTALPVGTTANGSLDNATDCRVGNFLEDYYSITAPQNQVVNVRMTSSQIDPLAVLTDSAGNFLAARVAAIPGLAVFDFFGPPRTYFVTATSNVANQAGSYALSVALRPNFEPTGCNDYWLINSPGTTYTLNHNVTTGDCAIPATGGTFYSDRVYIFLRQGQSMTVTMESGSGASLDPFLIVCNLTCSQRVTDNNSGGATTARVVFQALTTAIYFIDAGSAAMNMVGSYRLTVVH